MNNPARMDGDWTRQPDILLERNWTLPLRVLVAVAALLFVGSALSEALTLGVTHPPGTFGRLVITVLFGAAAILGSAFISNVRWTIRPNEIHIARQRIFGQLHREVVKRPDIRDITVFWENTEEGGRRIWLLLDRLSGPSIESPEARPGIDPEQLKNEIATRLLITPSVKHI